MKKDAKLRISRRSLFAGLGTTGAATLLGPVLAEAEGLVPNRLLIIHRPCGSVPDPDNNCPTWWWPSGSGSNYVASPLLKPFDPVRANTVVVKGIWCPRNDPANGDKHAQGMVGMMTGMDAYQPPGTSQGDLDDPNSKSIRSPVATIDQQALAKIPGLKGAVIPSLQLAGSRPSMQGGASYACHKVLSYSGPNQPMFGEARSQNAFDNIFGTAVKVTDPAVLMRIRKQNQSVFDFVLADLGRLRARLPSHQHQKLDANIQAIRDLESKIASTDPKSLAVVKPELVREPSSNGAGGNGDEAAHQTIVRNQLAIIRCAFQSDLTRVATITFADGNNPLAPRRFVPNPDFEISSDHHSVSHSGGSLDSLKAKGAAEKMYADELARMLLDMQNTPELAGNLLENTLVVYLNECSVGDNHDWRDIPILLCGGKFLKLNGGNYLQLSPYHYMNDLWSTMLTAWGVPTTTWGDAKYVKSPVQGLFG